MELRKAILMYNIQSESLKTKLKEKIDACRLHKEDDVVESLQSAFDLLIRRKRTLNQIIFSNSFSSSMQNQLLQGANKIMISVKNTMRTASC